MISNWFYWLGIIRYPAFLIWLWFCIAQYTVMSCHVAAEYMRMYVVVDHPRLPVGGGRNRSINNIKYAAERDHYKTSIYLSIPTRTALA